MHPAWTLLCFHILSFLAVIVNEQRNTPKQQVGAHTGPYTSTELRGLPAPLPSTWL